MLVVSLLTRCELRSQEGRTLWFDVSELAVLDDGTHARLRELGFGWSINAGDPWRATTAVSLARDVANVLLPDGDEDPADRPWAHLVALLREQGIRATESELRALPTRVELGPKAIAKLTGQR